MTPIRAVPPYDWNLLLALIQRAFAGMTGRIDPPSSLHRLTAEGIAQQAEDGEVWVIGVPAVACMFLTLKLGRLYLGKLAVEPELQARGYAKALVNLAEARCRVLGLPVLELETRVELVENHTVFQRLGFVESGRKAHEGFDRATSITFGKQII
ncbi:MAG: GNAT family N-acetyltransferase [Paracoccaceae bacterium]